MSSATTTDDDDDSDDEEFVVVDKKRSSSLSSAAAAAGAADKGVVDKLLKFVADNDIQMVSDNFSFLFNTKLCIALCDGHPTFV